MLGNLLVVYSNRHWMIGGITSCEQIDDWLSGRRQTCSWRPNQINTWDLYMFGLLDCLKEWISVWKLIAEWVSSMFITFMNFSESQQWIHWHFLKWMMKVKIDLILIRLKLKIGRNVIISGYLRLDWRYYSTVVQRQIIIHSNELLIIEPQPSNIE